MKMKYLPFTLMLLSSAALAAEEQAPAPETEVVQEQQPQFTQNTQSFNDWTVTCLYQNELNEAQEPLGKGILRDCQAAQIFQTEDNQQIMRMYMMYEQTAEGISEQPSLYFHVPLRAFLQPQVAIQVDQNKAIIVPYNFCDEGGCYAGGQLDGTVTGQFRKGNAAKIVFFNNERKPIALDLSLSGYTNASNYLDQQAKLLGQSIDIPKQQQ